MILVAIGLIALGRVLAGDLTIPVIPGPSASAPTSSTTTSTTTTTEPGAPEPVVIAGASTFDPYGEGGENDGSVGLVIDGDPATTWRTERYRDPIELLKPGVGLAVAVAGSPASIELLGVSTGAVFQILLVGVAAAGAGSVGTGRFRPMSKAVPRPFSFHPATAATG